LRHLCIGTGYCALQISIAVISLSQEASAVTREEAIAVCRMNVGRPIVQACIKRGVDTFEQCRATAFPSVRQCVMNTMGGGGAPPVERPVPTRKPPQETSQKEVAKRSNSETVVAAVRGSISDISPLPPDESRQPIELRDLESVLVTSKSKYENTVKLRNGSLFVVHIVESLKIKVVSDDAIEVEREQRRYDKDDNLIDAPIKGTTTIELGKERSVRGFDVVWKFEGSTLFYQMTLVEGGYRTVIPLFKQNDNMKCVVMTGFSREGGTGPVKTIGSDGSIVEILSSKKISGNCDVGKP
jgi:hypothetical protein